DKNGHQIFLEPEGLSTDSVYVNGFSTSLPEGIQEDALHTIPGLEKSQILRYGYAVEYDYFPSYQLQHSLESKAVKGLFFAGQVNGTSGYEEAAAQGLIAGMNAALGIQGKPPIVLDRSQAYIGVLIDDLVSLTINEPYRMFTSRAEYRLLLRQDNADIRLTHIGYEAGLVDRETDNAVQALTESIETAQYLLKNYRIKEQGSNDQAVSLWQLLKRPESSVQTILHHLSTDSLLSRLLTNERLIEQIEIAARYDGYIQRQLQE
ncbi:MAG: tRNA uridine-5-carboxymethylaminomethyl(34) synthesis enzyme MnmG, partial [Acinetobacter johnsonii]|nr:tRNA uridine-5-carboxymethylaminomethyl(34) synthesis enzyme MnmG [Acinetobacter johnsonii]